MLVYLPAISIALLALVSFPRNTILVACLDISLALLVRLVQRSPYPFDKPIYSLRETRVNAGLAEPDLLAASKAFSPYLVAALLTALKRLLYVDSFIVPCATLRFIARTIRSDWLSIESVDFPLLVQLSSYPLALPLAALAARFADALI